MDASDQTGEAVPVVRGTQRPQTVTGIAQRFAPAQQRILHLPVAERWCADKPLATDIGAAAVRLHQGEWVEPPDVDAVVERGGDDLRAVRAECCRRDLARGACQCRQYGPAVSIPNPRRVIRRGGDNTRAVAAELRAHYSIGMPGEDRQERAALSVPHARGAIERGGDDAPAIGAERRAVRPVAVSRERGDRRTGIAVP